MRCNSPKSRRRSFVSGRASLEKVEPREPAGLKPCALESHDVLLRLIVRTEPLVCQIHSGWRPHHRRHRVEYVAVVHRARTAACGRRDSRSRRPCGAAATSATSPGCASPAASRSRVAASRRTTRRTPPRRRGPQLLFSLRHSPLFSPRFGRRSTASLRARESYRWITKPLNGVDADANAAQRALSLCGTRRTVRRSRAHRA
jgi:hypothetical protein